MQIELNTKFTEDAKLQEWSCSYEIKAKILI